MRFRAHNCPSTKVGLQNVLGKEKATLVETGPFGGEARSQGDAVWAPRPRVPTKLMGNLLEVSAQGHSGELQAPTESRAGNSHRNTNLICMHTHDIVPPPRTNVKVRFNKTGGQSRQQLDIVPLKNMPIVSKTNIAQHVLSHNPPILHRSHKPFPVLQQENVELQARYPAPFLGPRDSLPEWKRLGADAVLLKAIAKGVHLCLRGTPDPSRKRPVTEELERTLLEYRDLGVVRPLSDVEVQKTQYWVSTFGRPKPNSTKIRLITDLRPVNFQFQTPSFKSDNWSTALKILDPHPQLQWGVVLDLKNWFFHLGLDKASGRWVRIPTKSGGLQFTALPFGLASSPYWSHRLSRPIVKSLRSDGHIVIWYVDDILVLGTSPQSVERSRDVLVEALTTCGIQIIWEKSKPYPHQLVTYLGHELDLKGRALRTPPVKLVGARVLTRKVARAHRCSPAILARVAGTLLDV